MSNQVETARSIQFGQNIDILLQQKDSRFSKCVRMESLTGKKGSFDRISATAAVKRTTRHGDTPLISTPHDRRWVFSSFYEISDLIDDADKVQLVADPTSSYVQNMAHALNRSMDDEIIAAFFGDAISGEDGGSTVSFPAANQIAHNFGGSASDISAAKLKAARKILRANEVDADEELYCAISAEQFEALLADDQIINRDYSLINKLDEGEIVKFMGFNFIASERLLTDASGYRRVPVWAKNGMVCARRMNVVSKVSERADKSYSTQVYAAMDMGAVRLQEGMVVEIKCDESA